MQHHEVGLIVTITAALVWAFAGGLLARRLGLPTLVGYLVAGAIIGPFTPGFVGDTAQISQLAEMGVIFLMFGVGLHFSLRDLWDVKDIAVPGAILQMAGSTALAFLLASSWGWPWAAGLMLGLAVSIASTVVLLRGLMDIGVLNSPHGKVAVGWLVLEDLATIVILVLLPQFFAAGGNPFLSVGTGLFKAGAFVILMLFVGGRFLPGLLMKITFTKSRELFTLSVVAVALGTAMGAAAFFDVSLALGAFLGGVVLGRSAASHHISADIGPFRDVFAVLFFVSVGMLVNPAYVLSHAVEVAELTALIVFAKAALTVLLGLVLPAPPRTMLVVAMGLSQIGEFSFIIGQAGVSLGILTQDQYSLILAGAVFSIILNPFMLNAIQPLERMLRKVVPVWRLMEKRVGATQLRPENLQDHVVVVGCGRVGEHIVTILRHIGIQPLVIESDPERMKEISEKNIMVLYGDAANSEILDHAYLHTAKALVITLPDESAAEIVLGATRQTLPHLPIVARAVTSEGMKRLSQRGATAVIHPELEGGLEIMRHALLLLGVPAVQVQEYADEVRRHQYETGVISPEEHRLLAQMMAAVRGTEVVWRTVTKESPLAGKTLAETDLRRAVGVSVIAVISEGEVSINPDPTALLKAGDTVGILGRSDQLRSADSMFFSNYKRPQ